MKNLKTYLLLLLAIVLFVISVLLQSGSNNVAYQLQSSLSEKEQIANQALAGNVGVEQLKQQGIYLFEYQNSKLTSWSSSKVFVDKTLNRYDFVDDVIFLGNTYYKVVKNDEKDLFQLTLIEIKKEYQFENEYLQNEFHRSFDLNSKALISLSKQDDYQNVFGASNQYLFSVKTLKSDRDNTLFLLFYFLAWLCLLVFFSKTITRFISNAKLGIAFVCSLLILVIRLAFIYTGLNNIFEIGEIFSPVIHATSSLFGSLGGFILNIAVLYLLVNSWTKLIFKNKVSLILPLILFLANGLLFSLCGSLITNSSFSLDLSNILAFNFYSLLGIALLVLLFVCQYLLIFFLYEVTQTWNLKKTILVFGGSIIVSSLLLQFFLGDYFTNSMLYNLLLLAVFSLFKVKRNSQLKFVPLVFIIGALSVFTAYLLHSKSFVKEQVERQQIAKELSGTNDYLVAYLFSDAVHKIQNDQNLKALVVDSLCSTTDAIDVIKRKYFTGFWNKYNVQIQFDSDNLGGFNYKQSDYSSVIKLGIQNLYISVSNTNFQTHGFDDLLMQKTQKAYFEKGYSYAKYYQNKLIYSQGVFDYDRFQLQKNSNYETYVNNYNHSVYADSNGASIVISTRDKTWYDYISSFAYLFLLYLLLAGFILLGRLPVKQLSFKSKIQVAIISVLVFSFVVVAGSTLYNTVTNYKSNIEYDLKGKTKSVKAELENRFQFSDKLTDEINFTSNFLLARLPELFGLDISIYDKTGFLITTSNQQLLQNKLIGNLMNPVALSNLQKVNSSQFVQSENIGKLYFLSSYTPFYNSKKELLGYLNIPYFSNQHKLQSEIFAFMAKLINVYLILIVLSILIIIAVSRQITKPLDLITEKLKTLQLGAKNQAIDWQSDDEIGRLVKEYNTMTEQLELSAKRLADSERESAWKDMAKQVAHEIKNPLTPMKLNVQHIERLWKSKSPELENRFEHFSKTMVEQIDTLANIADEFSNFATMPTAKPEQLNVNELLRNSVNLFEHEQVKLEVGFCKESVTVFADKDQLIRVFNNLVKNAIQAIDKPEKGKVLLETKLKSASVLISVSDNGCGISEDLKDKIFVPNFTTKSTGMGLGLAMVKRIVLNSGGTIWFESELEKGTTFYVELPLVKTLSN